MMGGEGADEKLVVVETGAGGGDIISNSSKAL